MFIDNSKNSRVWQHPLTGAKMTWCAGKHPDARKAPIPMCFTPEALLGLLHSVGCRPPETGAKGFGPKDGMGFTIVEFDRWGSERAGGAVYSPDVKWGEQRRIYHLSQPGDLFSLWNGDLHSHPGQSGEPSHKSGKGFGDLGYVEEVFAQNEWMEFFFIPILTGTGTSTVTIHPWICQRSAPGHPMIAELVICEPDGFPERQFNPIWLAAAEETPVVHEPDSERTGDVLIHFEVLIPEDSPVDTQVMIRGDVPALGKWTAPGLILDQTDSRRYEGSALIPANTRFHWKVAIGPSWNTVERSFDNSDVPNRFEVPIEGQRCIAVVRMWTDEKSSHVQGASNYQTTTATQPLGSEPSATSSISTIPEPVNSALISPSERERIREVYIKRLSGLVSPRFHSKTIVTFGVGAGSYTVEKLARMCPRCLTFCDFDIVEIPNLARTAYAMDDVGELKVDALARRISRINPTVEIVPFSRNLLDLTDDEEAELVTGADLLIAGTDQFAAQAKVNEMAVRYGIPAVFIGIHARGEGGRIIWYVPNETGCYRCMAKERYEAAAGPQPEGNLNLEGMVGSLIDCQFIDMVALKVAVAILERGEDSQYGRFYENMRGRNDIVVRCHPDYEWGIQVWDALLGDLPKAPKDFAKELRDQAIMGMDVVWLPGMADPNCPVCSGTTHNDEINPTLEFSTDRK